MRIAAAMSGGVDSSVAAMVLRDEGHEVVGCFENPNIHPLIEFRRRLKAQKVLAERVGLEMIYTETYGLREWLEAVRWRSTERPERCADCYRLRLERVAALACERGLEAFTTTLLVSRHQNHALVRRIGQQCARARGVPFLYRDWRPLAEPTHEEARRMNLYLQQYCGCVFSEWERYRDTTRHLYRNKRK